MATGRPPIFNTAKEMQERISGYFEAGVKIKTVVVGKKGSEQTVEIPVPTITGLAHFLGFESRQSFYDYENKPEFSYTAKRARLFIEQHYEELLQTGLTNAIFALKNFGWTDKQEYDVKQETNLKHTLPPALEEMIRFDK